MKESSLIEVVDVGAVEVVGETRLQGGRLCFFGLLLPHPELGVRFAITDLYNIYKIENIRHTLTK